MTGRPGFWAAVADVFAEALAVAPGARADVIAVRCAGDETLRREVVSLLDAHDRAAHEGTGAAPPAAAAPRAGLAIGPFRLVERIGSGGMGSVYRAVRDTDEFRQVVALKVINLPFADSASLSRFQAERQALASLQHPFIVSLVDGGVTEAGQAWLAMELVEGVPITTYCAEHGLSIEARLRLFQQVATAVHFAHRRFVLHCDLKPANILVTLDGVVKVLDFGVARLVGPGAAGASSGGDTLVPVTPGYASPEQLRGGPATTASDVFALGVLLFEMLTGRRPYATRGRSLDEVDRLAGDPRLHCPGVSRDLDAIVLKATAADPEARYGGVDALAGDVERYLAGLPVSARDLTLGYVVAKMLARHRVAVGVGAAAAVLVVVTAVVALAQWRAADRERDRAERRFEETLALARTVIERVHDEVMPLPGSIRARQNIVAETQAYLEQLADEVASTPALQLELARSYRQLGSVLGLPGAPNAGDARSAVEHLQTAARLVAPLADAPSATVADLREAVQVHMRLCEAIGYGLGRVHEARPICLRAGEYARRFGDVAGDESDALAFDVAVQGALARVFEQDQPEPYLLRARDQAARLVRREPARPDAVASLALAERNLGRYYEAQLQPEAAAPHWRRTIEISDAELAGLGQDAGADTVRRRVSLLGGLTVARIYLGDYDRAIETSEEALVLLRRLRADDPDDRFTGAQLGYELVLRSRIDEARGAARAAVDAAREAVGLLDDVPPGERLRDLSIAEALLRVARLSASADRPDACQAIARAVATFENLNNGPMTPRDRAWRREAEGAMTACR